MLTKLPFLAKHPHINSRSLMPTRVRQLKKGSCESLCPFLTQKNYFVEFERKTLLPSEDLSLFLWELENILTKADPDMKEEAKDSLLCCQFLKGLSGDLRLRLLEHDPTPS